MSSEEEKSTKSGGKEIFSQICNNTIGKLSDALSSEESDKNITTLTN